MLEGYMKIYTRDPKTTSEKDLVQKIVKKSKKLGKTLTKSVFLLSDFVNVLGPYLKLTPGIQNWFQTIFVWKIE